MYRIWLLALGSFAIGTDTFVVAGVLPEIATGLHVPVEQVGQVVTVFALTFGILAPVLAALTARVSRRKLLLVSLALFAVANICSAAAPNYAMLLAARVLAAVGASIYTPVAAATAATLVPAERRGRALALVLGGVTIATVFGVPAATYLGTHTEWRACFGLVAGLTGVALVVLAASMPPVPEIPVPDLRTRIAILTQPNVLAAITTTALLFVGGFTVYTYIAPALAEGAAVHADGLTILLFVFGIAGVAGNWLGGRLTDRIGPVPVLLGGLTVFAVSLILFPLLCRSAIGAGIGMAVWAISAWSLTVPQQHRLMSFAPDAPMVAVGLNSAAVFLGIGVSGAVGAAGLTMLRSDQLGFLGGAIVVVALGVAIRQRLLALDHNRSKQSGRWANPEVGDVPESSCRGSSGVKSSGGRK